MKTTFPKNKNWQLITNQQDWEDYPTHPIDIVAVLNSVKGVFQSMFGFLYVNSYKVIIKKSIYNYPYIDAKYNSNQRSIFLDMDSNSKEWDKFAYQFSHELCHFMINAPVVQNLKWFEETICELASQFTLIEMSRIWRTRPPYPQWKGYSNSLYNYALGRKNKENCYILKDNICFADFIKSIIKDLEAEWDIREINTLCAINLFDIFTENPNLWRDVQLLKNIPANLSFLDSLIYWHAHVLRENKSGIKQIIELFEL